MSTKLDYAQVIKAAYDEMTDTLRTTNVGPLSMSTTPSKLDFPQIIKAVYDEDTNSLRTTGGGGGGGSVESVNGIDPDIDGNVELNADDIPYDNSTSGLSATDVQGAIDEIAEQQTFIFEFNATTDWGSPSAGVYTITVPESTHEAGLTPILQVYEDVAGEFELVTLERVSITSTGDVSISVLEIPDLRFAGKLYIASKVAGTSGGGGTGNVSTTGLNNNFLVYGSGSEDILSSNLFINDREGLDQSLTFEPDSPGYSSINNQNVTIHPEVGAGNVTIALNSQSANLNGTNDYNLSGQALIVNNGYVNYNGNFDLGQVQGYSFFMDAGNGTDPVQFSGIIGSNIGLNVNDQVTVANGLQGYAFYINADADVTMGGSAYTQAYHDGSTINGTSASHTSFNSNFTIENVSNNRYVTGMTINPTINSFSGNAGYSGISINGIQKTFDTGSWMGVNVNPQEVDDVNFAVGLNISMDNVTVKPGVKSSLTYQDIFFEADSPSPEADAVSIEYIGGGTAGSEIVSNVGLDFTVEIEDGVSTVQNIMDALNAYITFTTGLNVTAVGPTNTPQVIAARQYLSGGEYAGTKRAIHADGDVYIDGSLFFTGALAIGKLESYFDQELQSGSGNPVSVHQLISAVHIDDNDSVTLADTIGVNTAMLANIGDNASVTTGFLGLSALALPAVVSMGSGSTVDRVAGATFAVSLDAGASGGDIDELYMCRALALPNGATTIQKLYGYKFDLPFGDPGSVTWGFYESASVNNYLSGNLLVGGTPGSDDTVSSDNVAMEIKSTEKALVISRMTTTERDAFASPLDGMLIYNTTTNQFQGYANGTWVSL